MATAAPFVKLLRQLSSAKDEYRSGALDITWDATKATLFFVFGQPNHATYEAEGATTLEGQEALAALLHNLPRKFNVAAWRKAVVRNETLKMTVDELMEPFAQLAGASGPDDEAVATTAPAQAHDNYDIGQAFTPDFDFSLDDFPMLPLGESMWSDAAVNVVHLDLLIPRLQTALIVLTGPKLRAAALTLNGQLIDAVWVDDQERAAGEGAAMALMGAREGTVSCYRIDTPKLVEALTMLWRCPARYKDMSVQWLDADRFLDTLINEQRDCVVRIDGPVAGVGFFMSGEFIACYTSEQRIPSDSLDTLRALLKGGEGTITIQQRAGDRALGRNPDEKAYHAYVAPTVDSSVAAPSYAAGAAAIVSGDNIETPAPTLPAEPAAEPVVAAPATAEEAAVHAADVAPAWAPEEPAPVLREEEAAAPTALPGWEPATAEIAHESVGFGQESPADESPTPPPVVDDGVDVAADFFGVAPEALTPAEPSRSAAVWPDGPAEPPAAAPANGTEQGEATGWTPREVDEAPAWNPTADSPESNVVSPTFGGEPSMPAAPADPASPFLFGLTADNGATVETAEAPVAVENDGTYEAPRIDLDFEGIKQDLIQIGVLWLGSDDVAPIADIIRATKPSVDDFVSTIDAIKGITVSGHDPSVIRAMAREMHYHAAEYLSGA